MEKKKNTERKNIEHYLSTIHENNPTRKTEQAQDEDKNHQSKGFKKKMREENLYKKAKRNKTNFSAQKKKKQPQTVT